MGQFNKKKDDDKKSDIKKEVEEKEMASFFIVASGKSLTSKRGILDAGENVSADDISGGKKAFDILVEKKYIVKG
jgi:hypothetical protein